MRKPLRCQIDVCMFNQPSDSSRYLKVRWDKNDIFHSVPRILFCGLQSIIRVGLSMVLATFNTLKDLRKQVE